MLSPVLLSFVCFSVLFVIDLNDLYLPLQSGSGAVVPSSSQLEGTAGDTTVLMESEMKESGSLELDPSVSASSLREPERASTLPPPESSQSQAVLQEGLLGRKIDVDGTGRKASNRLVVFTGFYVKPLI